MKVIGVVDLLDGRAVHARGGARDRYRPIREVAGAVIDEGDASSLLRAYVDLGVQDIYVADLDAILGRPPQDDALARLVSAGVPLWVDAGITSAARALRLRGLGISRVVVGLETLTSFDALAEIGRTAGIHSTVFSLDVTGGAPIARPDLDLLDRTPEAVAARAATAGAGTIIVLDLARVGSGAGLDLDLLERVRRRAPNVTLLAGGGVRGADDLARLAEVGCDGALVGTALLSGQLVLSKTPGVMSKEVGRT